MLKILYWAIYKCFKYCKKKLIFVIDRYNSLKRNHILIIIAIKKHNTMKKTILLITLFGIITGMKAQITELSNGNIGIGTATPSGKLEILKNANLSVGIALPDSGLVIRADNDGNDASLRFGVDNVNLKAVIQTQQTTTATKFDLLINPFGGNVGIGTMNSSSWKLAVNGKIRAKEIKVETGWSDFVFYDSYKLPTLTEVENHIKEKGHLKDIPSAKEVEINGIFLGDMDSKLLQKIEELTLYTIQQQKEIERLKLIEKRLEEIEKLLDSKK